MSAGRTLAFAALALAAHAPPAAAATATLKYEPPLPGIEPDAAYALTVRDTSAEANRISVTSDASGYTVRDPGRSLMPGDGCDAIAPDAAHCATPHPARSHSVFVDARDGSDIVAVGRLAVAAKVQLAGGGGRDLLVGGRGAQVLTGGPGADWLAGGDGDDRLDGGIGDDRLDGGKGLDTASYERRGTPVTADLAAGRAGKAGERDTLTDIENLTGGRGSDRLSGDGGPNVLLGGAGRRDVVVGRGGDDSLVGYRAEGGAGSDRLRARIFSCGPGIDFVDRALRRLRGPFPRACEAMLAAHVFVRPKPVMHAAGRLVFAMTCLYDHIPCVGRLELRDRRGRLGVSRFRLSPGAGGPFRRTALRLRRSPATRVVELHIRGKRTPERDWFRTRLPPAKSP